MLKKIFNNGLLTISLVNSLNRAINFYIANYYKYIYIFNYKKILYLFNTINHAINYVLTNKKKYAITTTTKVFRFLDTDLEYNGCYLNLYNIGILSNSSIYNDFTKNERKLNKPDFFINIGHLGNNRFGSEVQSFDVLNDSNCSGYIHLLSRLTLVTLDLNSYLRDFRYDFIHFASNSNYRVLIWFLYYYHCVLDSIKNRYNYYLCNNYVNKKFIFCRFFLKQSINKFLYFIRFFKNFIVIRRNRRIKKLFIHTLEKNDVFFFDKYFNYAKNFSKYFNNNFLQRYGYKNYVLIKKFGFKRRAFLFIYQKLRKFTFLKNFSNKLKLNRHNNFYIFSRFLKKKKMIKKYKKQFFFNIRKVFSFSNIFLRKIWKNNKNKNNNYKIDKLINYYRTKISTKDILTPYNAFYLEVFLLKKHYYYQNSVRYSYLGYTGRKKERLSHKYISFRKISDKIRRNYFLKKSKKKKYLFKDKKTNKIIKYWRTN